MQVLRQELVPADGVEFVTSLKLTPSTSQLSTRHKFVAKALCNLVVARSNIIRIFEVYEGVERKEHDEQRNGVNRVNGADSHQEPSHSIAKSRLHFVRQYRVHGVITGVAAVQPASATPDSLDRLLLSFKDAKIALLEWSEAIADLVTVSIHTYERASQLASLDPATFRPHLRVDPRSRCAALQLPQDAIAILPFQQPNLDIDMLDQEHDQALSSEIPYSPSFIIDFANEVDESIKHVIDFAFLPGLNNPTIAVLFQTQLTWAGRLKEFKDTCRLILFTVDLNNRTYPIITSVSGLTHDCLYMVPCDPSLGGVTIVASNSLIYVDLSGRRAALPVNGWAQRSSDMGFLPGDPERYLELEGSSVVFVDERTFHLITKEGDVYPVELHLDGRTVSSMTFSPAIAQLTIPSAVVKVSDQHIFVGSTAGPSVLIACVQTEQAIQEDEDVQMNGIVTSTPAMPDMDDDDDIYGGAVMKEKPDNGQVDAQITKKTKTVTELVLCDFLPGHGNVSSMAFTLTRNGDRPVAELVAATGSGTLGGFSRFQRDLPYQVKRKLHMGGARGAWSFPITKSTYKGSSSSHSGGYNTIIVSTDANPSPGTSRISSGLNSEGNANIIRRTNGTTVGSAPFFNNTNNAAIIVVLTNEIWVLEPNGEDRQVIKDAGGTTPGAKIRACSICDPYILIFREDDTIGMFVSADARRIRRKDMSPMGDKTSRYLSGCFYTDTSGIFALSSKSAPTSKLPQWLILVRPSGVLEIWALPKLAIVFSAPLINNLPPVLSDSRDPAAPSPSQTPRGEPDEHDVDQVLLAPLGEDRPTPHLFVYLRSGQMVVYEAVPCSIPSESSHGPRTSGLELLFVKILTKTFKIQKAEEPSEKSILAGHKKISRVLIPFATNTPAPLATYGTSRVPLLGVFFTGDNPTWFVRTARGGVQAYSSGHSVVHSFTACSLWEDGNDFFVYSDEGPCLLSWLPKLELHGPLPCRTVPRGRPYSHICFDTSTSLIVAAATLQARFASYNEDSQKVWEPDAPDIRDATVDCSALELISPDAWVTMDGFEFANNEYISALQIVTLETASTEAGTKDFIAVGTTIDRGEDLAVKGATYIFEIVEVVPDENTAPKRWYKLRLRCRDDAKGPVTALAAFNGYLVSSMGQKIFVRAMDGDERLVGVAFLDVGIYVTTLRTVKNLLLIGDAVKSLWLIGFQEDPYKLVILAKDADSRCAASADFLFSGEDLCFASFDEGGIIRLHEYDPSDPDSRGGMYLSLRTEFHSHSECRSSVMIARRSKDDAVFPQAQLICGGFDGSISSLLPVGDSMAKRMQLLQGYLVRNVQHVAALNPKALRVVQNDKVSRPLIKGIFDGNLLSTFEELPIAKQQQMSKQIGSDKTIILNDLMSTGDAW